MNVGSPELKAFKRAPCLELSKWEHGNLLTNLAEKKDTNGAFLLIEATVSQTPSIERRQIYGRCD